MGTTKRRRRGKDWPTLVAQVDELEIVDYNVKDDFSNSSAIRHKKFGVGVITKIIANNKIEVLFKDETRILGQNWPDF